MKRSVLLSVLVLSIVVAHSAFAQEYGDVEVARGWVEWVLHNLVWIVIAVALFVVGAFAALERSIMILVVGIASVCVVGGFFAAIPTIADRFAGGGF